MNFKYIFGKNVTYGNVKSDSETKHFAHSSGSAFFEIYS